MSQSSNAVSSCWGSTAEELKDQERQDFYTTHALSVGQLNLPLALQLLLKRQQFYFGQTSDRIATKDIFSGPKGSLYLTVEKPDRLLICNRNLNGAGSDFVPLAVCALRFDRETGHVKALDSYYSLESLAAALTDIGANWDFLEEIKNLPILS